MHARQNSPVRRGRRLAAAALAAFALVAAACGGDDGTSSDGEATTIRLGYFANVTHAPAILGVNKGFLQGALGEEFEIEVVTYNSGTEAIEALLSGAIDASFIGPNPAINGFAKSDGTALRIVSGTTSGGASLIVDDSISSPADLAGKKIATPSLGNTQDVALRAWLIEEGFTTDTAGGGDVSIIPQDNADTLTTFIDRQINGAWVPEPWATRLVLEGGGKVLLNEAELWPDGQFVTTHLIVATEYLADNPTVVENLLSGLVDTIIYIEENSDEAKVATNDGIEAITTKRLADATIDGAWENLTFTLDPIASSLQKSADDAIAVELLDPVELDGVYDLDILNKVLKDKGLAEVSAG
jgi:NitT/TauT family transport system substrate-binding protein